MYLLKTDLKCVLFFLFVLLLLLIVLLRSYTKHGLKRLGYLRIINLSYISDYGSVFYTPCSLYDNVVITLYFKVKRVKEINLACTTESYTYYSLHL